MSTASIAAPLTQSLAVGATDVPLIELVPLYRDARAQLPGVEVLISGFGPKATSLAARIGDGYVSTMPDGDLVKRFRSEGGGGKIVQAGMKCCYRADEDDAIDLVAVSSNGSFLNGHGGVFASSCDTCRGAAGVCDVAEVCSGSSAACPPRTPPARISAPTRESSSLTS